MRRVKVNFSDILDKYEYWKVKCVKSVLGEFSSGVSVCRNKRTQSDFGAPLLPGSSPSQGTGSPSSGSAYTHIYVARTCTYMWREHPLPPALLTPTYMWREQAKAHIYVIYVNFWEIIIAFPNGGQWAPCSKFFSPWFKPLVTPLLGRCNTVCVRRKVPPRLDVNKGGTVPSPQTGFAGLSLPPKLQPPNWNMRNYK